jgi:AhpD family alkylhydroperoxidase
MQARLDAYKAAPAVMKAVLALESYVQKCGLEPSLIDLVKLRASQINGCAYCVHFNHHEPKAPTAKLKAQSECAYCHQASAKKDEVWTQFYPLLDN